MQLPPDTSQTFAVPSQLPLISCANVGVDRFRLKDGVGVVGIALFVVARGALGGGEWGPMMGRHKR